MIPITSSYSSNSQLKVHQCSHHHDWSTPINVLWLKSLTTEEEDSGDKNGALGIIYTSNKKEMSYIQLELDVICYAPLDMSASEAINKVRHLVRHLVSCPIREIFVCVCVFSFLFLPNHLSLTLYLFIYLPYSC
jgi:hypothetical protein